MTKDELIKSLEIRVGDEPYFVRLYGLIAVERMTYNKAAKTGLPRDNDFYKQCAAERRGFEMCLRIERYTGRMVQGFHDKIIDHINSSK